MSTRDSQPLCLPEPNRDAQALKFGCPGADRRNEEAAGRVPAGARTKDHWAVGACAQHAAALARRRRRRRCGPQNILPSSGSAQRLGLSKSVRPESGHFYASKLRKASSLVCGWACATVKTPPRSSVPGTGVGDGLWAGLRKGPKGQGWVPGEWWRTEGMMRGGYLERMVGA